jgi:hypothetical protein
MYGVKERSKLIACFMRLEDAKLFAHCLDPFLRSPIVIEQDEFKVEPKDSADGGYICHCGAKVFKGEVCSCGRQFT